MEGEICSLFACAVVLEGLNARLGANAGQAAKAGVDADRKIKS